jgi:hypothetical protein
VSFVMHEPDSHFPANASPQSGSEYSEVLYLKPGATGGGQLSDTWFKYSTLFDPFRQDTQGVSSSCPVHMLF